MRILFLYRPVYPSFRAQHIQILRTATALAKRGHQVTILANKSVDPNWKPPEIPHLQIISAPVYHSGLSSLWFRFQVIRWAQGPAGWIIARDKKRLLQLTPYLPARHRIALESHELDSILSSDGDWYSIEQRCLARVDALICNCGGTLQLWVSEHSDLPPSFVVHNATDHQEQSSSEYSGTIRSFGSHHDYKAADWLATVAATSPHSFEVIGTWNSSLSPAPINVFPPLTGKELSRQISSSSALLLCLGDNIFGQYLSSPLKLWDYLASQRPIIAPSLASVQEIVNKMKAQGVYYYQPQDSNSFTEACMRAVQAAPRTPTVRHWDERAEDLEILFQRLS